VSHFIKIVPSEMTSPSTFPRPLQTGQRRKSECLSEIISAWLIRSDDNFSESTLRVGSPDLNNAGPLRSLPPPLLDKVQQRDSMICGVNHTAKSLSRFKRYNASNPAQVVSDKGGDFCMSVTTIKRDDLAVTRESQCANHTVMEISTTRTSSYDSQDIYTLRTRRKDNSIQANLARKIVNTRYLYKFTVTSRKLVKVFSLLLVVFFNLSFQVKSLIFTCFLAEILLSSYKRDNLNSSWCEINRSINRIEKSPPQISAFIKSWVPTFKISPFITFLKEPLLNQWWPHESESLMMRHPKVRPSQSLGARSLSQPTINLFIRSKRSQSTHQVHFEATYRWKA